MLSVIIIFHNEGEELRKTIESATDTAHSILQFVLIDDASDDGYNYCAIAEQYKAKYIKNDVRIGSAPSRDKGVEMCETEYFIQLDAHMRFYIGGWDVRITDYLQSHPNTILCCRMVAIDYADGAYINEDGLNRGNYAGARLGLSKDMFFQGIKWLDFDSIQEDDKEYYEIPCVLGANYASSKTFYKQIDGLNGLIGYGYEEQFLSVKCQMCGGQCILDSQIFIGHLFGKPRTFRIPHLEAQTNEYVCYLICGDADFLRAYYGKRGTDLSEYMRKYLLDINTIIKLSDTFRQQTVKSIHDIYAFNSTYSGKEKQSV